MLHSSVVRRTRVLGRKSSNVEIDFGMVVKAAIRESVLNKAIPVMRYSPAVEKVLMNNGGSRRVYSDHMMFTGRLHNEKPWSIKLLLSSSVRYTGL